MTITRPTNFQIPFCNEGTKNNIPAESQVGKVNGAASLETGFPPSTRELITGGGIQPDGKDINGILHLISNHIFYRCTGGRYRFNAELAASLGGYQIGAILQSDDGLSEYVNVVAGNSTNFNTSPGSIGVSWLPWAGVAAMAPTGSYLYWPLATPPMGFLECDGSYISKTSYANLYRYIGGMYGSSGDTFRIPDRRGFFARGKSGTSGVDPDSTSRYNRGDGVSGNAVGTKQTDQMASHLHVTYVPDAAAAGGYPYGRSRFDSNLPWVYYSTSSTGGSETRPVNIYQMVCIKY